jgi:hypothetical protein
MKQSLFLVLVLVAACTPSGGTTTSTSATTAPASTTVQPTTTETTTASTSTAAGGCGADVTEEGTIPVDSSTPSDAEQLASITWETNPECETFVLAFTSAEGAPATTAPSPAAELIRSASVLRVFVELETTAVTDQLVQSGLVDRIYVVREADRSLFVDFHLSAPALAAVAVNEGSGDVLVMLEPGGSDYDAAASFADNVVVVTPAPGPVDVPISVTGYSRNFEANTIVRVTQDNNVLAQDFTTAADWVETWGEYELTISPEGAGPAELFVGEQSAQDGSDRGLVLDITLPG